MRDSEAFGLMVMMFIAGAVMGASLARDWTTGSMQRKAVANGAAEWVIQPETGETTFRWKGAADGAGK